MHKMIYVAIKRWRPVVHAQASQKKFTKDVYTIGREKRSRQRLSFTSFIADL